MADLKSDTARVKRAICGNWNALIKARGKSLKENHAVAAEKGSFSHCVRVVDESLTHYLRWELNSLNQRHIAGG